MIKLKSEGSVRAPRRGARWLVLVLALVGGIIVGLAVERWRGGCALKSWKVEMAAKGEVLEPGVLWPTVPATSREFSNRLAQVMAKPLGGFSRYIGQMMGMVPEELGTCRRGSQETQPPLESKEATN